jgi:uncharacterized protein YjiS (DUF1127 family)
MTSAFSFNTLGTAVTAAGTTLAHGVMGVAVMPVRLGNALVQLIRAKRNRLSVMHMLEMDDHMLRDIGLTRGDVYCSLATPASMDPSSRLRIFAVERRAGNRAQARERLAEAAALKRTEAVARRTMAQD